MRSPDSPETILASGHFALRFPALHEAAFHAASMGQRRRLMMACGILGGPSVLIGTATVNQLIPDIASQIWFWVLAWLVVSGMGLAAVWFTPARWRRHWHGEALTTVMATLVGLLITWIPTASRLDTAFTHSATAALPVMYICIASRQRFYWALVSTITLLLAYAFFVKGFTPQQELLAASNLRLMALSCAFTLAANYAFEYRERRNWLLRQIERSRHHSLLEATHHLRTLSTLDPLTGLANRRHFDAELARAWAQAVAMGQPLSLLVIDVDFFKPYNDTRGHPAGDTCLMDLARLMRDVAAPRGSTVGRLGGEEFAFLLPDHTLQQARALAADICRATENLRIPHGASSVSPFVTVSVGVGTAHPGAASPTDAVRALMAEADRALYRAKREGRNGLSIDGQPDFDEAAMGFPAATNVAIDSAKPADIDTLTVPGGGDGGDGGSDMDKHSEPKDTTPPLQEEAIAATLASRFRSLQFPAAQEALYEQHGAATRRRHIAITALLGLLLYNLYVGASRPLLPELGKGVQGVPVWLNAIILMMTALAYFAPLRPRWREAVASLGTTVIGLASTWVLSHSQSTATLSYAAGLSLTPMFAGVIARQPFWFTCVPAVSIFIAAACMLIPDAPMQRLVYYDTLFIIMMITAFTLILAYTLEHGARKEWLLSQLDQCRRTKLEATTRRLQQLTVVDPLTGIGNRRQLEDDLQRLWQECRQDHRPVAMLIVDIDHFKQYNDGYGHPQGDQCLGQIASIIHLTARADKGLAARLGGEEFGIILPGARAGRAMRLGERLCQAVREAGIEHVYADGGLVTVSVGVASLLPSEGMERVTLLALADQALYEAKRAGRDRVVVAANATQQAPRLRPQAPGQDMPVA